MVRLARYVVLSTVGASAVVYHAFRTRQQFYPAMVYLSNSKICLLVLLNMALVILCAVWQLIKTVFLGSLREAELERLNEQSWREVMEILFAMTIFREEFCVSFVARITVLLFIKAFHWLAQKRVEYIETTPSVPRLSHLRIIFFMLLLLSLDSLFLRHSIAHLLRTKEPSVSMFFAFEYTILATSTMATFVKYALYVGDMVMDGQWDNKAVYIFYLELVRDLIHLSLYLLFFFAIFMYYGLPLHLVRELYETFRSFKARVADFIRYRRITSNMNDRFPDATAEELSRGDATCIICREEMLAAKKLPCGHLFHVHCLRSWLERQQTCPTCRAPVLVPENAADTAAGSGSSQANRAAEGQGGALEGNAQYYVGGNLSPQHQERLQAAIAAAARYNSSFVYPPLGTGNWCLAYVPLLHPAYRAAGAGQNGVEERTVPPGSTQGSEQVSGDSNLAEGSTTQQVPPAMVGSGHTGQGQYVQAPPVFGLYQVPHGYWPAPRSARAGNGAGADGGIPAIPLGGSELISLLEPHLRQQEARLRGANNGAGEEADGGRMPPPDSTLGSFLDQVVRQQDQILRQKLEAVTQQLTELKTALSDKAVAAQQPSSSTEVAREESGGPTASQAEAGRKGKAPIHVGEADAKVEASTSAGA